jgi:RNA-directed DNA polymerase
MCPRAAAGPIRRELVVSRRRAVPGRIGRSRGCPQKQSSPYIRKVQYTVLSVAGLNNVEAWPEVRDRLNQILRGWCAYFSYGTTVKAYQAVDYYVYESVRHYLRRRHQVRSRGTTTCFSRAAVYGRLGVVQLRRVRMASRS